MTGAKPAADLAAALDGAICPEGIGGHEALRRWSQTIVPATRAMGESMNLAYVPASPTAAALTFDLAVSSAQIMGALWETGAGAIAAENQALRWLADLAGWPAEAGGVFVQGGTVGNLSALVAARERARSRRPDTPAAVADRRERRRALVDRVRGPRDGRRRRVDRRRRRRPYRRRTRSPRRSSATATRPACSPWSPTSAPPTPASSTTSTRSPTCATSRVIWLHVDGAYGLASLAAPSMRERLAGIERADSFVVDPHKWLFAPYDSCALVYRNPADARAAHAQSAGYLEQVDRDEWNPSDHAIQLSRRARGLPLWFSLATYGTDHYTAAIEHVLSVSRRVTDGIRQRDHLELVMEPDLSIVLFRRPGWTEAQMLAWSEHHARIGTALIVPTRWHDELVFRLCFVNPRTDPDRVLRVLDTPSV